MLNLAGNSARGIGTLGATAVVLGAFFCFFSVVAPNVAYGHFLVADTKDLSWGPTVFRCLLGLHGLLLIGYGAYWRRRNAKAPLLDTSGEAPGEENTAAWVYWTLGAFSIVAFVLRIWDLNSDLWIDEVFTLLDFVRQPLGTIVTSFPSQNQHMLFSLLARFSTDVFGESAWALRLPSVIFGVASIWAFFFLARHLFGNREALLGSALMTVSYHHIWYSQNARGYMGLLLFTLLSTWCWLEALKENRSGWWIGYIAAVVGGMWIHPTMAFVVAGHGLVHVLFLAFPKLSGEGEHSEERAVGARPFIAWALSVTVTLQLYALALPEFFLLGLHEESKPSEWTNPLWVFTESLAALKIGFGGIVVVILGMAFVAFGWLLLFRKDRRAALVMTLPALLAGGFMVVMGHNIWPRFFFFSMGFGLIIVIHGATQLPTVFIDLVRPLRKYLPAAVTVGTCLALMLIAASVATVHRNYSLPKQDFSGARSFVEHERSQGDGIVAVSLAGVVYGRYLTPPWPVASTASDLEALENKTDREWLVYTIPIEIKAFKPELWKVIERDYSVVKVFPGTLNGGEVFVCKKKT
ncbi:MAG: glycosyltransferase family 39 protein [Pyrinomonadaceae bacterium]|nr:glycosyltransferase family 39 protein [Pyrinomonadaceae bacterium]